MEQIVRYFPGLSEASRAQLAQLGSLYAQWNARINVVSRADIGSLYEHHVLHSLAIAKAVSLSGRVLDLGTGGGFPGIPLAILLPQVRFVLIDGTGKKVRVAKAVAEAVGLTNVVCLHRRAEELRGERFDAVVTRGVAPLPELVRWARPLTTWLIALKGGDLGSELQALHGVRGIETWAVSDFFREPFFEEKQVVSVLL